MSSLWQWLIARAVVADSWRSAIFAFLFWRPWAAVGVGLLAVVVFGAAARGSELFFTTVEVYGVVGLAIALTSGSVSDVRVPDRHLMLFQLRGTYVGHHLRLWILCLVALIVGVAACWAVVSLVSTSASQSLTWHVLIGAELFGIQVFAAAIAATSLVRRGGSGLVILWTLAPILIAVALGEQTAGPSAQAMLEALFVPLNALFSLQRALASGDWTAWRPFWGWQLALFPAACAFLAVSRLRAQQASGL